MTDASILPILQKIPLFEGLDPTLHQEIIQNITMQYYPAEHVLFNQGEPGENMYIIKSGAVHIYREEERIAILKEGDFFGEMALMSAEPRNASAKVIEEAEIFILNKADFDKLLVNYPDAADKIKQTFTDRYTANNT